MDKESQIAIAEAVTEKLSSALSDLVNQLVKSGVNVSDRVLMTGIASFFMESMALSVPPDKWEMYLSVMLNDDTLREKMFEHRKRADDDINAIKRMMGVESDDDLMAVVKERVASKGSNSPN